MDKVLETYYINQDIKAITHYYRTHTSNETELLKDAQTYPIIYLVLALGYPHDKDKTLDYLIKASNQGISKATMALAHIYEVGEYETQSIVEATHYYQKAYDQGCEEGAIQLLKLFYQGHTIPNFDPPQIIETLKEKQCSSIYNFLAELELIQPSPDYKKVEVLLNEGYKLKDPQATYQLAHLIDQGKIAKTNEDVNTYLKEAVLLGHQYALVYLVEKMEAASQGVEVLPYLKMLDEKGNEEATLLLAQRLYKHPLYLQDIFGAYRYFRKLRHNPEIKAAYLQVTKAMIVKVAPIVLSIILILVVVWQQFIK